MTPDLDADGDLHSEAEVLCPHAACQTVHRVVGQGDGFLCSTERQDHQNWAEYLQG
ncbi:hypothetical protein DPMN_053370 [Dreissena polymorpha]|uniref:Uncharacterized protein n=1 Tax=Dreissena polymorpha TaxID=45954 RepID=A0A9D4HQM8_DREPO|nr:hypothetical protein DPMN_053370 [Dreissena polymorpha]